MTEDILRPTPGGGRIAMMAGVFLASFGACATAYTYLRAAANDRQRRSAAIEAESREANRAIELLNNPDPARRCEGARILGAQGKYDFMWMLEMAAHDVDPGAQACAVAAIAQIKAKSP